MISKLVASMMRRARHHTLIFHRVLPAYDPMSPQEPTTDWFRRLIGMLAAEFEVISLDEALSHAQEGTLSGRTISLTFDDGYADNYTVALPILEEFNIPATFFVGSSFVDGGRMWNDSIIETLRRLDTGTHAFDLPETQRFELSDWESRRRAAASIITAWKHLPPAQRQAKVDDLAGRINDLPTDLMLTRVQLRALAASSCASIGGHTRSHPILASQTDAQAREEIEGGKHDLEAWIQQEVTLFAYPNGKFGRDYLSQHTLMVRQAGFSAAVATDWGTLDASTDRYAIPRFTPWHKNLSRFSIDLARCHYGLI